MSNIIQKQSKWEILSTIRFRFPKQILIFYIIICIGFCLTNCTKHKQSDSTQYVHHDSGANQSLTILRISHLTFDGSCLVVYVPRHNAPSKSKVELKDDTFCSYLFTESKRT